MSQKNNSVRVNLFLCFLGFLLFASSTQAAPKSELLPGWSDYDASSSISIDHSPLDQFLARYRTIGPQGIALIAYSAVSDNDRKSLQAYLANLQKVAVRGLNRPEQFAYWVNLYNAATIDLILRYQPKESIRDINISPGFFSSGPWGKAFLLVEGRNLSLDNIEHGILRPLWKDPRTHYVLNCASLGCPDIPEHALKTADLENTLNSAARTFINHPRAVQFNDDRTITLSSIYDWFGADFGNSETDILNHLKKYTNPETTKRFSQIKNISGYRYSWSLNRTINNQ